MNSSLSGLVCRRVGYAVAALMLLTTVAASGQVPGPYAAFFLHKYPQLDTAVVGDFNGDGRLDLTSGSLFARGRGDGTFDPPTAAGRTGGGAIAAGDFNEDGRLDILATSASWEIETQALYVVPGNGNGTFGTPIPAAGVETDFAVVRDLDGDGHLDIAVDGELEYTSGAINVYRGHGNFEFTLAASFAGQPSSGVAGDFNEDGRPDLAFATYCCSVTVLLNQGGMLFTLSEVTLDAEMVYQLAAGDVTRDGHLDLAVTNRRNGDLLGGVTVLPGTGSGGFGATRFYDTGRSGEFSVAIADFTRDGFPDVATGNRSALQDEQFGYQLWDSISILHNNTSGSLGPMNSFSLGNTNQGEPAYTDWHHRLRAADLTGDGHADLIASPGAVLLNYPPGANRPPVVFAGPDRTQPHTEALILSGHALDPDNHWLEYRWYNDSSGELIAGVPFAGPSGATWPTPGTYVYRLDVYDEFGGVASDRVTIAVTDTLTADVQITAPHAGQTVSVDSPFSFTWSVYGSWNRFDVYSSPNGGRTFTAIPSCTGLSGSVRQCTWTTPGPASNDALIRVVATAAGGTQWIELSDRFSYVIGPATSLPPGWIHADIGGVGAAGNARFDGTTFRVAGSGVDIWAWDDEFHYAWTQVVGDVDIVARVTSVQNIGEVWTKAGVMIRQDFDNNSQHAAMFVTPTTAKGLAFQRRRFEGQHMVHTGGPAATAPMWVRLTRRGNQISAYYRVNEANDWTLVGTDTVAMEGSVLVGLAVTSHSDGSLATATFTNVSVSLPTALPDGWTNQDVGAVGAAGSAAYFADSDTFTVRGSGTDIWGSADEFHFVHRAVETSADNTFELTARVGSVENVNAWTKAGLMIRAGTGANAAHMSLLVTPTATKGVAFQRRRVNGQSSLHTAGPALTPPVWLKLEFAFSRVRAFYRIETGPWTLIGEDTFAGGAETMRAGLVVSSHVDGTLATATFDNVSVRRTGPWVGEDIGAVGVPGADNGDPVTTAMTGSGADIWGTADAFRFRHTVNAAHGLSARVLAIENTHVWAKAGVMIRDNLTPGSRHVMMILSAGRGVAFQYRGAQGGESFSSAPVMRTAPQWVRIRREGNWFFGEASHDGVSWFEAGRVNIAMSDSAVGGLAVTSHDNTRGATATFDDIVVP